MKCEWCRTEHLRPKDIPNGAGVLFFCSKSCSAAWEQERGLEACSIETAMPGGKNDGILEASGLRLQPTLNLNRMEEVLINVAQLLDGWHCDTAWSEWDEEVRKGVSEILKMVIQAKEPRP